MKTTLIVSAHPSRAGFTHQAVARIEEIKTKAGHKVEVVDLYTDAPLSFLRFEDKGQISANESVLAYQAQVARADEILFVFPCWWGDTPSVMRNWFDHVFAKGFAFKYAKRRPVGLLHGKKCFVIMTTGTPAFIYRLTGITRAMRRIWSTTRIKFCGMHLRGFLVIGGMDTRTRDEAAALARIEKLVQS